VASLLAAEQPVAGLLLLSYPLHRPGHPEQWRARTAHWPRIGCPVLLLSGESDPFARLPILLEAVRRLPRAELVAYPRVRHGIGPVLDDALDRIAAWVATLEPDRA
jgi:predicted alpha/beta-hydrolase family hydrolase